MKKFVALILAAVFSLSFTGAAFAETGSYVYEGENYYKAQTDNPAADLQPGEQIDFALSDNADFIAGTYKLTVISCGNRESMTVKVNGTEVGTINRTGTGFGMDQMTNDVLETEIELSSEDTLSVFGQEGEFWGWVDSIKLELVKAAADITDAAVTADNPAAIPKTGVEFPAYLVLLSAVSCIGIAVSTKAMKKSKSNG